MRWNLLGTANKTQQELSRYNNMGMHGINYAHSDDITNLISDDFNQR